MATKQMATKQPKLTKKRQAIMDLLQSQEHHMQTAQSIKIALPDIDLATIYRGLEYLHNHGLIDKIVLPNQEAAYEYTTRKHHHAICTTCGKIDHLDMPQESIEKIKSASSTNLDTVSITLHGVCKEHAEN
jgi:Fe2+ or Zn2+ uptake regulation protein